MAKINSLAFWVLSFLFVASSLAVKGPVITNKVCRGSSRPGVPD